MLTARRISIFLKLARLVGYVTAISFNVKEFVWHYI